MNRAYQRFMSVRDIKNCPNCGAPVHHFYTYIGDIDYAQCERNSSIVVKEDGSVVHLPFGNKDVPDFFCWGEDY